MLESDELSSLERELLESARSEEPAHHVSGILLAGLVLPFSSFPGPTPSSPPLSGVRPGPSLEGLNGASLAPFAARGGLASLKLALKVLAWGAGVGLAGTLIFVSLNGASGENEGHTQLTPSSAAVPNGAVTPSGAGMSRSAVAPKGAVTSPQSKPASSGQQEAGLGERRPLGATHHTDSTTNAAVSSNPSLTAEIAALDPARLALRSGNGRRALTLLNRYRTRFPSGTLKPEADALQAQAQVLINERPASNSATPKQKAASTQGETPKRVSGTLSPP